MKSLETERLLLRSWQEEDYLDLFEFLSDDKVANSSGTRTIKDIEESKNIIATYISYDQSYAIVLKSESKVIGSIGMDKVILDKTSKKLEERYIGYTVNSNYWRNGYAPEAAKCLLKHLFTEMSIDLIWCSHYDFNEKSKRVIEKTGFKYTFIKPKVLKVLGGKDVLEIFYKMCKEDIATI